MLRQLCDSYGYGIRDVRKDNGRVFCDAAYGDRTEIIAFLSDRFGLTRRDALCDNGAAIRCTGALGHTETFRYLTERFDLSPEDIAPGCQCAQANGRHDIIEFCKSRGAL